MTEFKSYTPENAPEKSKDLLGDLEKKYGMNLNVFACMAESPLPIKLYKYGQDLLNEEGTLTAEEINLVQLAVSVQNECLFCVPAHSFIAKNQFETDSEIVEAIREGKDVPNEKFEALVRLAKAIVQERGHAPDEDIQAFLKAGYTKEQIFEIIAIVAYKTITNYTSAIADEIEPNEGLKSEEWTPLSKRKDKAA